MARELQRLTDDAVASALTELGGWELRNGKLARDFVFADFVEAIGFIDRVAVWADTWDHHPEWSNVYNTVQVELVTHDVGGISQLDVQLATKMNELAGG